MILKSELLELLFDHFDLGHGWEFEIGIVIAFEIWLDHCDLILG